MLLPQKEIEAYFAAALLAFASLCSARPNQNEMLVKSSAALAQDSSAKVPWSPASSGGVMYLPEINAFLVPAESLLHSASLPPPQHTPTISQPPKRRRPVTNFIKYINNNFQSVQPEFQSEYTSTPTKATAFNGHHSTNDKIHEETKYLNTFYRPSSSYYGSFIPRIPLYSNLEPELTTLDRTLAENDKLLDKLSGDLDETAMILVGKEGQGGTRLTLRPVAKAVAGPRGVAVASPVAQAVLRRRDPPPEISYEPDSVAVAGPGGQAYSHPELILTYIDDPSNTTSTTLENEQLTDNSEPINHNQEEKQDSTPSNKA